MLKKVYTAPDASTVHIARVLLADYGMTATVQSEQVSSLYGFAAWPEVWPTLWVRDEDEAAAAQLLADFGQGAPLEDRAPWTCPKCGETNGAQFSECWQCAPSEEAPPPADQTAAPEPIERDIFGPRQLLAASLFLVMCGSAVILLTRARMPVPVGWIALILGLLGTIYFFREVWSTMKKSAADFSAWTFLSAMRAPGPKRGLVLCLLAPTVISVITIPLMALGIAFGSFVPGTHQQAGWLNLIGLLALFASLLVFCATVCFMVVLATGERQR